jgi:predicted transcriptional regulator
MSDPEVRRATPQSDTDALDERLRAVERALTENDGDLTGLRDAAELTRELESLSARLDEVDERLDELDAATQALRGYVGNVRAVNESVERRADAALAKAEALEAERDDHQADRRGREPDGDGFVGHDSDSVEADDTEFDRRRPCRCGCRRRRVENLADENTATTGTDGRNRSEQSDNRGLLARIAGAL